MGFTRVFLRSYLTPSNNRIFYNNFFLIKPVLFLDYKKHNFFFSDFYQPGQLSSSTRAKPWLPWSIYGPDDNWTMCECTDKLHSTGGQIHSDYVLLYSNSENIVLVAKTGFDPLWLYWIQTLQERTLAGANISKTNVSTAIVIAEANVSRFCIYIYTMF